MRKLLSLFVAALLALTFTACDEQPTQVEQPTTDNLQVATSHGGGSNGARHGTFTRPAWGDDHLWEFKSPKQWGDDLLDPTNPAGKLVFGSPSNENSHSPFYIIGPDAGDDGTQSEAFIGPHDHVFAVPKGDARSFNANWHTHVVLPAPDGDVASSGTLLGGLAHAADTDGNGTLEQLTNVQAVLDAEQEGNVIVVSTPEVFVCPVRDIEG